jgi:hypothetical protein
MADIRDPASLMPMAAMAVVAAMQAKVALLWAEMVREAMRLEAASTVKAT